MSDNDIVSRLRLSATQFLSEFDKAINEVDGKARSAGSVIGKSLGGGLGDKLRELTSNIPVLGGALSQLSGPAIVAGAGIGAIAAAIGAGISATEEYEHATRQLEAVLKATGNQTGRSVDELKSYAEAMETAWARPAEEILGAQKQLATFGGVAGETFDRAIQASANLAATWGTDLSGETQKLGTALQNLAQGNIEGVKKGFKDLGRAQTELIEHLAKTGHGYEAQQALLEALEKRYGGAAEAAGQGLGGAMFRLEDAFGDASRAFIENSGILDSLTERMEGAASKAGGLEDRARSLGTAWGAFFKQLGNWDADLANSGFIKMLNRLPPNTSSMSLGEAALDTLDDASHLFGGKGGYLAGYRQQTATADNEDRYKYQAAVVEKQTAGLSAFDNVGRDAVARQKAEGDAQRAREAQEEAAKKAAERAEQEARAQAERNRQLDETIDQLEKQAVLAGKTSVEDEAQLKILELQKQAHRELSDAEKQRIENATQLKTLMEAQLQATKAVAGGIDFKGNAAADRQKELEDPSSLGSIVGRIDDQGQLAYEATIRRIEGARDEGLLAIQALGQSIGGSLGDPIRKVAGLLQGMHSGDFTGVGGQLGGLLTLASHKDADGTFSPFAQQFREGFKSVFDDAKKGFKDLAKSIGIDFDKTADGVGSSLGAKLGAAAAGAGIGQAAAGLTGGNKLGGAIGGALGGAFKDQIKGGLTSLLGSAAPALAGPLSALAAPVLGALGGAIGGALKTVKQASATVSFAAGKVSQGVTGNSSTFQAAAGKGGDAVSAEIQKIADALGGTADGTGSVSIGIRHGDYRVDTTGSGITKIKKGAVDFNDDAEAAVSFAVQTLLQKGVISGISQASKNILSSANDLDAAIEKAVSIETIDDQLKAIEDPLSAALDSLGKQFKKLVGTLDEGAASSDQYADAEKLYQAQRQQIIEQYTSELKNFRSSLSVGSSSPLSYRDQEAAARTALQGFEDKIAAGQEFDQGAFTKAGQDYLDVERALYGSTEQYFAAFDKVQALTDKAIESLSNVASIKTDPVQQAISDNAAKTAVASAATADNSALMVDLLQQIAAGGYYAGGGGGGAFIGSGGGYVRAA